MPQSSLAWAPRALMARAEQQAYFIQAMNGLADGEFVPVPGGVLIRDAYGNLLGAIGISGDTSDNDEAAAIAVSLRLGWLPKPAKRGLFQHNPNCDLAQP